MVRPGSWRLRTGSIWLSVKICPACRESWIVSRLERKSSNENQMTGDRPQTPDAGADARARLMCYLVVAQLVGHARTGEWLRTDHLVESSRMGLASLPESCGWQDRLKLARASIDLAPQFLVFPCFRDEAALVGLFTDGWQLDYSSPVLRGIIDVCNDHLFKL